MKKIILTILLMFSLVININALTLKEDTSSYTTDVYIFGSTKFDNNTIITLSAAGIAGMNEAKVQIATNNQIDTESVQTYYYSDLTKCWNLIDLETGKLTLLTKEETSSLEEKLNVYYVNNIEKIIEVPYEEQVDEGSLKANSSKVTSEASIKEGKIQVPATWIGGFTFTSNNTLVTVDLSKTLDNNLIELDEPIIKMNPTLTLTSETNAIIEEETTLKAKINSNGYTGINSIISITSSDPENTEISNYNKEITLNTTEENITLKFTKEGTYTITYNIELENGITLNENVTYNVMGKGSLETYAYGVGSTYQNNTLTITGNLTYTLGKEKSGYLVTLFLSSPKGFNPENSVVKLDGKTLTTKTEAGNSNWFENDYNKTYIFIIYDVDFIDKTTSHTLEIEWTQGYTETMTINLDENIIFGEKPVGTISCSKCEYNEETNTLEVKSSNYNFNGEKSGYVTDVEISLPSYTSDPHLTVDGKTPETEEYSYIQSYDSTTYHLTLTFNNFKEKLIEVEWGKGYKETFTVKLTDEAISEVEVNNAENLKIALKDNNIRNIKITDNFTIDETLSTTNPDLNINLNENTISLTKDNRIQLLSFAHLTFSNGTIKGEERAFDVFDESNLNITEKVLIDLTDETITKNKYGIYYRNYATIQMSGTLNIIGNADCYAITGDASTDYKGDTHLDIDGNISSNKVAIYHPQKGIISMYNGHITADTPIIMKSGRIELSNGTITATGENNNPYEGINLTGDVIYIEKTTEDDENINITINGGTLTSYNAYIIRELNTTSQEITYDLKTLKLNKKEETNNGIITTYINKVLPTITVSSNEGIYNVYIDANDYANDSEVNGVINAKNIVNHDNDLNLGIDTLKEGRNVFSLSRLQSGEYTLSCTLFVHNEIIHEIKIIRVYD